MSDTGNVENQFNGSKFVGDENNYTQTLRDMNNKREDYLSWTDYFMATAFLAAKRSKDPCSQVGACIVNEDKKIVGVGYNGMPHGCSDDKFPWSKEKKYKLGTKYLFEINIPALYSGSPEFQMWWWPRKQLS